MTAGPSTGNGRAAELRLARLHLRLGAHQLARAELEAAAGEGILDADALLDLAEIRWRTGDLPGAGVAANAFLSTGRGDALGFVIAAEAAGAAGHLLEARRLAARAVESLDRSMDAVYAGMPQGHFWPVDRDAGPQPVASFFSPESLTTSGEDTLLVPLAVPLEATDAEPATDDAESSTDEGEIAQPAHGLWPEPDIAATTGMAPDVLSEVVGTSEVLEQARAALDAGDHASAAGRLADLLRSQPALAATVLHALRDPSERPPWADAGDEPNGDARADTAEDRQSDEAASMSSPAEDADRTEADRTEADRTEDDRTEPWAGG